MTKMENEYSDNTDSSIKNDISSSLSFNSFIAASYSLSRSCEDDVSLDSLLRPLSNSAEHQYEISKIDEEESEDECDDSTEIYLDRHKTIILKQDDIVEASDKICFNQNDNSQSPSHTLDIESAHQYHDGNENKRTLDCKSNKQICRSRYRICIPKSFEESVRRHTSLFPFGKSNTLLTILCSILALTFSITCRYSTDYVRLKIPLFIGTQYQNVDRLGVFYVKLCLENQLKSFDPVTHTETIINVEYDSKAYNILDSYGGLDFNMDALITYESMVNPNKSSSEVTKMNVNKECKKIHLGTAIEKDSVWKLVQCLLTLSVWMGLVLTLILCTTPIWRTINLTPLMFGLGLTYLIQCLSFFFYDSKVCRKKGCNLGSGTFIGILASILWFLSALGVLHMLYDNTLSGGVKNKAPNNIVGVKIKPSNNTVDEGPRHLE